VHILAIVGSYRKGGNTDLITDRILEGAQTQGATTEKVFIDDLKIASCQGCMECRKEGICRQQDDVASLVKKIEAADGVIFGSPIYGNYITGQAKLLLDRLMGVINKTVFVSGTGPVKVTRLEPKPRNVVILMTVGADRPECADDSLKLLRRMLGSFTNGGLVEEFIAAGLMDAGQAIMDIPQLLNIVRRMYPSSNHEAKAIEMKAKNQAILDQAKQLGIQLTNLPPQ
jgi:NAD(P)H-dependent FMN reductase